MTTIKSYTNIEQSKRLAEILPLESADTIWDLTNPDLPTIRAIPYEDSDYSNKYLNIIPCWSLAALLEEIPEVINFDDDESDYVLEISKENYLYYLSYGNPFEHDKIEVEPQENFVDACYEMIIKLHKQKLL